MIYTFTDEATFWGMGEYTGSCILWTGNKGVQGYGEVRYNKRHTSAHRLAFYFTYGYLPPYPAEQLDHTCNVRDCINPEHLDVVDTYENNARKAERNTHCPKGHDRTVHGRTTKQGVRFCFPCANESRKAWDIKKREEQGRPFLYSHLSIDDMKKILQLRQQGMSAYAIAKMINRGESSVKRVINGKTISSRKAAALLMEEAA